MTFEGLPDELLVIICSYLTPYHIIKSFNDLNSRLNRTINQYRQHLDFRDLNFRQFYFLCKSIQTSFGEQIRSIILSNAAPSVRQLILFRKQTPSFASLLPNLESLTLIDHYDDELDLYLPSISSLKYLKELKIHFHKNRNETTLVNFIPQILTDNFAYFEHLPKRRKRDLVFLEKLSFTGTGYLKLTPLVNQTITHLTIEIENTDDLYEIFSGFISLEYLNVYMKQLTVCSDVLHHRQNIQCLSLLDFRCKVRWQPEKLTFDEFISIMSRMPHLRHFLCTLITETSRETLNESDYINPEKWENFTRELYDLVQFDCLIKCPLKSSICFESDLARVIAKISRIAANRAIDIQLYQKNDIIKNESKVEYDVQELQKLTGTQLASQLKHSQELTLYNDFFVDDERMFSTFPESLLLSDRLVFSGIRCLDLLGEFPNLNNIFLIKFVEQLLCRSPNLQSIGFFLYWIENMTDLVLDFLRPLKSNLKQIKRCYLYTEGDIDENFVTELADLLPSLTLLSVKIDWYCKTAEVIDLILRHMKDLNHLELVLEDIPSFLDEDYIDRIKIEKDIESLAMVRDTRDWLKRNTILGKKNFNKIFHAEKTGNDLKLWL